MCGKTGLDLWRKIADVVVALEKSMKAVLMRVVLGKKLMEN
jgi:hypothetical protein